MDRTMPQTDVERSEDLLDELSAWVRLETPTTDPAAAAAWIVRAKWATGSTRVGGISAE
jgi:hypothetical protein